MVLFPRIKEEKEKKSFYFLENIKETKENLIIKESVSNDLTFHQ